MRDAYFAGGCFWCITPVFYEEEGVLDVVAGYSGGDEVNPTYEQVKHQQTGHREAICISYDETKIGFSRLLQVFLENVDPFDDGGQFIDRGASYTLAVFAMDETELEIANRAMAELAESSGQKVCITVEPYKNFYPAEEYHQNYFRTHPAEFAKEMEESGRRAPSGNADR